MWKKLFAVALISILLPGAAHATCTMSGTQIITNAIDPTTETGTQLAADLNNSLTSLLATNRGSSRPCYAATGTMWVDSVSSTLENVYFYDGNNDLLLASYNPSTHALTLANALPGSVTLTGSPTAPTAASNTSSTQIASTAFANPASSQTSPGYMRFPNGMIFQWGSVTVNANAPVAVSFATACSNNLFSISLASFGSNISTAEYAVQWYSKTSTGFSVANPNGSARVVDWTIICN